MGARGGGAGVEVQVLGRIGATVDGREIDLGGPRQQALLAALATRAGRTVPNDVIIDAVWDGVPPDGAATTFRSYVARLRRAFDRAGGDGSATVVTDSAGYRLHDAVDVDADLFELEVARARERLTRGELAEALRLTSDALARWEGAAFGRFSDRMWATPTSSRLEELRLAATELRARALLDADRGPQAAALLEELTAAEPYREAAVRLLGLALYRSGRDADAMRVVRDFRARLTEEHGLDPSDELSELEAMILHRDPRLDRPVGGRRLRGYVLHEPIAHSPLGTVHRAEQPSIGRDVAVAVLPTDEADAPDVVRAFEARLQAVAGLHHPHVLPVYDYWREPGGAYVVTRLLAGTLDQALRGGRVAAAQALAVGEQVAAALAAAHERGVVHGAIGPDAVVVDARGDAFLWGFPLMGEQGRPAHDVAAVAALITEVAGHGAAADGADVAVSTLPPAVRDVLERAQDPRGGPVVTAAGLAATLTAARTGPVDGPAVPVDVGPNPYRGLAAFGEADADVFFGRTGLTEQLIARILRQRAVAVVGPSGAGKSSVVRAGVLPRLRDEGAFVTTMLPGARPLAELELALSRVAAVELTDVADEVVGRPDGLARVVRRALPTPDGELVLVVDQFEELFTLSDPTERDCFLTAIADVVADHDAPVRVVVTLRADFLGAALAHTTAGRLLRERSVMVGPLDDDELHEVVVRPAEVSGVAVEPALVTALVADATRAPGSLPMVQFALTEAFAAAGDDGVMTLEAYRRIGGIEGVLGQRAEEVHASLDDTGERAAHALFRRLVVPAHNGPPTRRRALRSELEHVPDDVIQAFGRARLLRFDHEETSREPTVEVAHEALFVAWPRLMAWIEEEADDLRVLSHLTAVSAEWEASDRDEAELYRGGRLDTAIDFASANPDELSPTESAFLRAARHRRQRDEEAARRSVRRLRVLTGGLAVGLVVALAAGAVAWTAQQEEAEALLREQATARSALVDSLAFAAASQVTEDPERASLLAAEAYALEPDLESQAALLGVLDVEPRILSITATPFDTCSEPTGRGELVLFSLVTVDGEALEIRTLDQEVRRRIPLPPSPTASCMGLTPSGDTILTRHTGRYETQDLDLATIATRDDVLAPDDQRHMDLHPTRPEAALVLDTGEVAVVTVPGLETRRVLELDLDQEVATCEAGQAAQSGERQFELTRAVGYSEDATLLAVADGTGVHVVDDAGQLVTTMAANLHPSGCAHPFVSAGAGVFGHLTADTLVIAPLQAPADRTEVPLGAAATPYRRGVAVEPGGRRAAVATANGIQVIDLATRTREGAPIPVAADILDLFWSDRGRLNGLGPNGAHLFAVDRPLLLGEVVAPLPLDGGRTAVAVAPDGSGVVVAGPRTTYVDTSTGAEVEVPAVTVPMSGGRWLGLDTEEGRAHIGDAAGELAAAAVPALVGAWPDGAAVAVAGDRAAVLLNDRDRQVSAVLVLDATTGALLERIDAADGSPWTAAVPLGEGIVMANLQYEWSVVAPNGEVLHDHGVLGVGNEVAAVDEGGRRYVTADWNGDLHLVDTDNGDVVDLTGPASFAVDVAFAGRDRLVSRHVDGSSYLWDIAAGALVGRLWQSPDDAPPFAFFAMEVDREAGDLLQVTPQGLARIPLEPDDWFETVCARVDRGLSGTELRAVAPGLDPGPGCG